MGIALRHFDICCREKNIKVEYIKKNIKDKRFQTNHLIRRAEVNNRITFS